MWYEKERLVLLPSPAGTRLRRGAIAIAAGCMLWKAIFIQVADVPDLLQDPAAVGTRDMENADRGVGDLPANRGRLIGVPAEFLYDFFMGDHDHPLTC